MRYLFFFIISVIGIAPVSALDTTQYNAIEQRTKPIGQVYTSANTPPAVIPKAGPQEPQTIYNSYCATCHATGIAGAPITGNKSNWSARLTKGEETLINHAINGFNAMPAKGGCISCSDEEIAAAVKLMLSKLN